jgi:hypothetical protein
MCGLDSSDSGCGTVARCSEQIYDVSDSIGVGGGI